MRRLRALPLWVFFLPLFSFVGLFGGLILYMGVLGTGYADVSLGLLIGALTIIGILGVVAPVVRKQYSDAVLNWLLLWAATSSMGILVAWGLLSIGHTLIGSLIASICLFGFFGYYAHLLYKALKSQMSAAT